MKSADTYCHKCHRLITFIKTPAGKKMPCEAGRVHYIEDPYGRSHVYTEDGKRYVRASIVCAGESLEVGWLPHWGQCGRGRRGSAPAPAPAAAARRKAPSQASAQRGRGRREAPGGGAQYEQMSLFGGSGVRPTLKDMHIDMSI